MPLDPRDKKEWDSLQEVHYAPAENPYLSEYGENEDLIIQNVSEYHPGAEYKNIYWDEYSDEQY